MRDDNHCQVLERLLKESSQRRREAELYDAYRLYDHMHHTPVSLLRHGSAGFVSLVS